MENHDEVEVLLKKYDGIIRKIVNRYKVSNFDKEDLYQVGVLGMLKAYKNFIPNEKVKFTTYAYPYILGEIRKYIREDKGVKISRNISKLNYKIDQIASILSQKLFREPTTKEIEWEVFHFSLTNNSSITSAPQTIENVKKFMPPPPTLEESKKLVKFDSDCFYIRYGTVNVYVCMEE